MNLDYDKKNVFEEKFNTIFAHEINNFKGPILMSWSTEEQRPTVAKEFLDSLTPARLEQLRGLISQVFG